MILPGAGGGVLPAGGGLPGPGGSSLPGGVCLVRGGARRTPPVDRITDTSKNITLATTSLRPVKICWLLYKFLQILMWVKKLANLVLW